MYPMPVNTNNRLPKAESRLVPEKTFAQSMGTMAAQAACVVVIAKLVDLAFEAFMNRRRAQQAQAPQRGRREEVVA
jgi:hypothetical protein